jgi:hypothetical protein
MRIDYFIVSAQLKDRIIACEMHGCGIELEGKMLKYYLVFFCVHETLEIPIQIIFLSPIVNGFVNSTLQI